jgi:hypothetical protein
MSSPLSDAFKNAINRKTDEIEKDSKNKVVIAMRNTEERVREKIKEIIEVYGMTPYYNGYTPSMYVRTNNLRDSGAVSPFINEYKKNGYIGFQYGANFDEDLMDHSEYYLHMVYKRKKHEGQWERDYLYHDDDVNEKDILDNFRAGKHPLGKKGAFFEQGPIWMKDMNGMAPDALREWKNSGAIQDIFKEELMKLLR